VETWASQGARREKQQVRAGLKRNPKPLQYAFGYSLDLYCDRVNLHHGPTAAATFGGENFRLR
jgi:hypothetical protein